YFFRSVCALYVVVTAVALGLAALKAYAMDMLLNEAAPRASPRLPRSRACLGPHLLRRDKHFVQITKGAPRSRPATNDVDAPMHHSRSEPMASSRHRRHSLPGVTNRIIRLVLTERAFAAFAAEHVDPAANLSRCDSTAGSREIRGAGPAVGGGI